MTRCIWCLKCGVELHHVTGRTSPPCGPYFDPPLVLPLCRRHHAAEHVLLRRLGLEWPEPGTFRLAYRLSRLGTVLGRSLDLGQPFVLTPSAAGGARLLIIEAADALARVL